MVGVFVLLAMTFGTIEFAAANANARYQQQIEQFKQMLDEQAQADSRNLSAQDRAQALTWLQEAEVLLANGRQEAASRRLRRVEYAVDLVRAMVAAGTIDTLAERQEAYYHTAQQQIAQFEAEIQDISRKKDNMERELQRLRQ
jgi:hypothetical protein